MSGGTDEADLPALALSEVIALLRLADPDPRASRAATEILRRFQPLLRKYWAWHRLGEYEDFVQEALLRLFVALPRLRDPAAFPGLFRRVVIGTATDVLRARGTSLEAAQVEMDEEMLVAEFDDSISTPVVVRTYLEHLPPREREVIELSFLDELPVPQVARRMGLTEGGVRTARSRAIARLRSLMGAVTKKTSG
jgi:RNA polymerase sigma factor (sigma-70 family)